MSDDDVKMRPNSDLTSVGHPLGNKTLIYFLLFSIFRDTRNAMVFGWIHLVVASMCVGVWRVFTFNVSVNLKDEFLISDPVFESSKTECLKRHIPTRGLDYDTKMHLLQLHNLYRGNVTPPAGNMAFMVRKT